MHVLHIVGNKVPRSAPQIAEKAATGLQDLGRFIRTRRKTLKVSATAVAEASGISRVTLHRIEKGEPSVTIGAWMNVMESLGLRLQGRSNEESDAKIPPPIRAIPLEIPLADYPQLRSLCWHIRGLSSLSPIDALEIYERNARHIDKDAMPEHEHVLLQNLKQAFLRNRPDV